MPPENPPTAAPAPARPGADQPTPAALRPRSLVARVTALSGRQLAGSVGIGLVLLGILFVHNVFPGALPSMSRYLPDVGIARCWATGFPWHSTTCPAVGYPTDLPIAFGLPQLWPIAALIAVLGLDPVTAFRLVWAAYLIVAAVGAQRFFTRFTAVRPISWLGATVFLVSPIVLGQAGYGPLLIGFALLPGYLVCDLWFLRIAGRRPGRPRTLIGAALVVVVVRLIALFTDPYSAVISILAAGLLYAAWIARRLPGLRRGRTAAVRGRAGRQIAVAAGVGGGSVVLAWLAYTRYVGTESFAPMSMDFFRGQGVDLVPQLVPSNALWFADLTGLQHSLTDYQGYSDGPNLTDVFVGWVLLGTAVAGLVLWIRRRRWRSPAAVAVVLIGAIGFLLALGPSLKIGNFRADPGGGGRPAMADYYMPASAATGPTGLSWIYRSIPGIDTMRALYRWELPVKLALLALAMAFLGHLVRRRHGILAGVLALLILLEALPVVPAVRTAGVAQLTAATQLDRDVVAPLSTVVRPGERILLINPAPGAQNSNAYLADWICPAVQVRCYNISGDKTQVQAWADQPREVVAAIRGRGDLKTQIDRAFAADAVDAVVLVNFGLLANADNWPPVDADRAAAVAATARYTADSRYSTVARAWFTVLRLRH